MAETLSSENVDGKHEVSAVMDQWEMSKENVQPLKQGRIANLAPQLCDGNQARLKQERQEFETLLRTYEGDDPFTVWNNYIKWTLQNFPSCGKGSNLQPLLERCLSLFQRDERYKNDRRYISAWITYASMCDYPLEVYDFLYDQELGMLVADTYSSWSSELEMSGDLKKANAVLENGIKLGAEPTEKLKMCKKNLELRVGRKVMQEIAEAGDEAEPLPGEQRMALNALTGQGKRKDKMPVLRAGTIRKQSGLSASHSTETKNTSETFKIFCDDQPSENNAPVQTGEWRKLASNTESKKENVKAPGPWNKNKLGHKSLGVAAVTGFGEKPTFSVHEDSDTENEARAPRAPLDAKVLSTKKEPPPPNFLYNLNHADRGPRNLNERPMYAKSKVYGGIEEFSFEELKALKLQSKKQALDRWQQEKLKKDMEEKIRMEMEEKIKQQVAEQVRQLQLQAPHLARNQYSESESKSNTKTAHRSSTLDSNSSTYSNVKQTPESNSDEIGLSKKDQLMQGCFSKEECSNETENSGRITETIKSTTSFDDPARDIGSMPEPQNSSCEKLSSVKPKTNLVKPIPQKVALSGIPRPTLSKSAIPTVSSRADQKRNIKRVPLAPKSEQSVTGSSDTPDVFGNVVERSDRDLLERDRTQTAVPSKVTESQSSLDHSNIPHSGTSLAASSEFYADLAVSSAENQNSFITVHSAKIGNNIGFSGQKSRSSGSTVTENKTTIQDFESDSGILHAASNKIPEGRITISDSGATTQRPLNASNSNLTCPIKVHSDDISEKPVVQSGYENGMHDSFVCNLSKSDTATSKDNAHQILSGMSFLQRTTPSTSTNHSVSNRTPITGGRSLLIGPSPTVNTKEAMGLVMGMFNMTLGINNDLDPVDSTADDCAFEAAFTKANADNGPKTTFATKPLTAKFSVYSDNSVARDSNDVGVTESEHIWQSQLQQQTIPRTGSVPSTVYPAGETQNDHFVKPADVVATATSAPFQIYSDAETGNDPNQENLVTESEHIWQSQLQQQTIPRTGSVPSTVYPAGETQNDHFVKPADVVATATSAPFQIYSDAETGNDPNQENLPPQGYSQPNVVRRGLAVLQEVPIDPTDYCQEDQVCDDVDDDDYETTGLINGVRFLAPDCELNIDETFAPSSSSTRRFNVTNACIPSGQSGGFSAYNCGKLTGDPDTAKEIKQVCPTPDQSTDVASSHQFQHIRVDVVGPAMRVQSEPQLYNTTEPAADLSPIMETSREYMKSSSSSSSSCASAMSTRSRHCSRGNSATGHSLNARTPGIRAELTVDEEVRRRLANVSLEDANQERQNGHNVSLERNEVSLRLVTDTENADISNGETYSDPFSLDLVRQFLNHLTPPLSSYNNYTYIDKPMGNFKAGFEVDLGIGDYQLVKCIGDGAYARIYQARKSNADKEKDVVLKLQKPAWPWEFYICSTLNEKLAKLPMPVDIRPSIMSIDEAIIFLDGSCLINEYHPNGSLLDLVNIHKMTMTKGQAKPCLDEFLAAYLTIQMLYIMESMHACEIIHCDVKPDNFVCTGFVLLDENCTDPDKLFGLVTTSLKLIDFGRSLNMSLFPVGTSFYHKVATDCFQCTEMLEGKPWTYQTDLFGMAACVNCMLSGDYMNPYHENGVWKITTNIKRNWAFRNFWKSFFHVLLNIPSCTELPDLRAMRRELQLQFTNLNNVRAYNNAVLNLSTS